MILRGAYWAMVNLRFRMSTLQGEFCSGGADEMSFQGIILPIVSCIAFGLRLGGDTFLSSLHTLMFEVEQVVLKLASQPEPPVADRAVLQLPTL